MADDANLYPAPEPHSEEDWASGADLLPGHVNNIGREPTVRSAQLELVTDQHVPRPGARREATLRPPRPARTAREKAARDQGEGLRHKTPPEWQPHLTVVGGTSSTKEV